MIKKTKIVNFKIKTICMVTSIHPDFDVRIMKEANFLLDHGFNVHLICPWNCRQVKIPGIIFLTFKRATKRALRFINYFRISKYLLKRKYDLYHFHDIDILPLFCLVKILTKKPVIYDIHENYPDEMLVRYWVPDSLRWILYYFTKYLQLICAYFIRNLILVVPSQEADFSSLRYNKIIIRNFASKTLLETKQDNYETRNDAIIFTGIHYIAAGSILFLDIAKKILEKFPNLQFYCIDWFEGDYLLKKQMFTYIESHSMKNKIIFLPPIRPDKIMSYLNTATIGLAPYLRVIKNIKGIPTKIFEYMAAGLPIVCSNLPLLKEIIEKEKLGLVADPENVDDFVEKISFLIYNRSLAKEMGENGTRAFINQYSWEVESLKLKKFYESFLSGRMPSY